MEYGNILRSEETLQWEELTLLYCPPSSEDVFRASWLYLFIISEVSVEFTSNCEVERDPIVGIEENNIAKKVKRYNSFGHNTIAID